MDKAAEAVRKNRLANKRFFDRHRRVRRQPLLVDDLVLLHNTRLEKQWSDKLRNRWLGPYRIKEVRLDRGTYKLAELDGALLSGVFPGERLKRFFLRRGVDSGDPDKQNNEND